MNQDYASTTKSESRDCSMARPTDCDLVSQVTAMCHCAQNLAYIFICNRYIKRPKDSAHAKFEKLPQFGAGKGVKHEFVMI